MAEETKGLLATAKAKVLFGATFLVGILAGYFLAGVFPPPEEDLTGTIGGVKKAEKYRAEQITDADVILQNPEIQKLLQNDKVLNLLENSPAAFEAISKLEPAALEQISKLEPAAFEQISK
ncbi:MAG: hypothetical protein ACE5HX_13580, partial [bacterium]